MKKISFLTLLCILGTSFTTKAEVKFTGLPEYQVERAKKDQIFDDDYLDYENKADKKVKRQRIEEFYEFFHNNFNLEIDGWKKLSDEAKITKLLDFLTDLSAENKGKINKMSFSANFTKRQFYVEKYQDEFAEKVANLEGKVEQKIFDNNIVLKRTTYVDENGKKYTKDVYTNSEGNDRIELKENNQPFFDYESVHLMDDGRYFVNSRGFSNGDKHTEFMALTTDSVPLPKGYTVAKDRSEHLSDEEKGKLIVIPEDKSLLPDGVEIIDDGRGGKIVKAPESAYKPNGNLNLKPDPTLEKTTYIVDWKKAEKDYYSYKTDVLEYMTQEGDFWSDEQSYGNTPLSGTNTIYLEESTIDAYGSQRKF